MKKRIAVVATIVAVAALVAVPLVYAEPGQGGRGHGFGMFGHLNRVKEELNLSDQQVDQIKAIFADAREQNKAYREEMHGGFKAVADTLLKNPNDISAAQALLDQQFAAEKAMKANLLNATSKALNVLTAEQRAELAQKIGERAERHRGKRRR